MDRALTAVAGVVAGLAVVLAVEIQVARGGSGVPDVDHRLDLDLHPRGATLKMVWLGDSTAAGVGATSAAGSVPGRVADGLGRPVEVEVLAVSGATVADVLRVQAPRLADRPADIVLVSVGANDTTHLTARGQFRRRYRELLRAVPPGAEVVLLGVPDMGATPRLAQPLRAVTGWAGERLDAEIAGLARKVGARYVDIAGTTGPAFRRHPGRYFAADRYHPSDAGYDLWARAVLGSLGDFGPERPGRASQSGH